MERKLSDLSNEEIESALSSIRDELYRRKNMEKSPWDMIRDLRRLFSISGPRTKARTSGAPSYSNFFMR